MDSLLWLYFQQAAKAVQAIPKVIRVLAKPRHHDAPFYGSDHMLRQNFRLDLDVDLSGLFCLTQDPGQEVGPIPENFSY